MLHEEVSDIYCDFNNSLYTEFQENTEILC